MKKILSCMALAAMAVSATAQSSGLAYERPAFGHNWSVELDGGVISPLKGHSFFQNMRGTVGLNVAKQLTPAFALGAEAAWGINTSNWAGAIHSNTAFDASYVGMYGTVDLFNLVDYSPSRVFSIGVQAGAGWGHNYQTNGVADHNFFATKAGLVFNFNICPAVSIAVRPSVIWDMSDAWASQSSASYNAHAAAFSLQAGVRYNFGPGFKPVVPYNQAQIDDLNGQINALRGQLSQCNDNNAAIKARAEQLAKELEACRNAKPEVVKEVVVDNRLNTVLDVFFNIGSASVSASQMPNVERIASYMKSHPQSRVVIKGYASKDGNLDSNIKLAQRRAEAVKDALVKKFKISASRITAEGQGIGDMFEEDSWNRVSVCTLENE